MATKIMESKARDKCKETNLTQAVQLQRDTEPRELLADAIQEYGLGDLIRDEWHYWLETDDYNWQTALWKASLKRLKEFLSGEYEVELNFDINGPKLARAINRSGLPRMVMD